MNRAIQAKNYEKSGQLSSCSFSLLYSSQVKIKTKTINVKGGTFSGVTFLKYEKLSGLEL